MPPRGAGSMTTTRPPGRSTRSTSDTQRARTSGVSVGSRSAITATSKLPSSNGHMPYGARIGSTSAALLLDRRGPLRQPRLVVVDDAGASR